MKQILVTGGAGFIGSHFCRALLAKGYRVTALDNFSTGRRENIAELLTHPQFALMNHDILTPLPTQHFDAICNLACPASPVHYQTDPVNTLLVNVVGTYHLLELARSCNAVFLQTSTSEVYGNPKEHPQTERYLGNVNPIGPRACYDEGKRAAETLCFDFHRKHQLAIKVVRIFNTYGPLMRHDDGRVVSNFICQALAGTDITLYGDGQQTRSFCYVDDLVDGLVRMLESDAPITGPINLGNPDEYTVEQLAETIIEMMGSGSSFSYKPMPQDDPELRKPDISLAKELLGWEPNTSLERGLTKTIAFFKTATA